jgi:hypothetical protein
VVHKALVQLRSNIDIAKEHRVKPLLVSRLVCKLKKNPKAIDELKAKQSEAESFNKRIKDTTQRCLSRSQDIWKAEQIQE